MKQNSMLIDVGIFAICGFFLWRFHSRTAAVILLVLSVLELINTYINNAGGHSNGGKNIGLASIVCYVAIRAVEATFKLHGRFALTKPNDVGV
jgi:hypothetical protein